MRGGGGHLASGCRRPAFGHSGPEARSWPLEAKIASKASWYGIVGSGPMRISVDDILRRLAIDDPQCVEIESKRRVVPEEIKRIRGYLLRRKSVQDQKSASFFDQFLDTPRMEIFKRGASLRLRYKKEGQNVYLQYKGPGFRRDGLLYRSEFSTERVRGVLREESRHDIVHFAPTSIRRIIDRHAPPAMARAIRDHLGAGMISRIACSPIISAYRKEKFLVELGTVFLEPSLDRVLAFHIGKRGPHPLSTFFEYENEIKALSESLEAKLRRVGDLLAFDRDLSRKFDLHPEPLDKYHRCASYLL